MYIIVITGLISLGALSVCYVHKRWKIQKKTHCTHSLRHSYKTVSVRCARWFSTKNENTKEEYTKHQHNKRPSYHRNDIENWMKMWILGKGERWQNRPKVWRTETPNVSFCQHHFYARHSYELKEIGIHNTISQQTYTLNYTNKIGVEHHVCIQCYRIVTTNTNDDKKKRVHTLRCKIATRYLHESVCPVLYLSRYESLKL